MSWNANVFIVYVVYEIQQGVFLYLWGMFQGTLLEDVQGFKS